MKTLCRMWNVALGITVAIVAFGALSASPANAQCVDPVPTNRGAAMLQPQSWRGVSARASLRLVSFSGNHPATDGDQEPIVGFWQEKFIAGDNDQNIPLGTVIDAGLSQWHSDGTEIHNSSGRPPATQSFCLGVWAKTAPSHYKLNHFAISWDSSGTMLVGLANIRENVTVSPDHNSFEGTFTIDQYDQQGTRLAHITGRIRAKRITMHTTVHDLL